MLNFAAMFCSVSQGNELAYESEFRAVVFFNGVLQWGPGSKWETSCPVNLKYFPFDEHHCKVQ